MRTLRVIDGDLAPAFLPRDVLHYDESRPVDVSTLHGRVVVLTTGGLRAGVAHCGVVTSGAIVRDVLAAWLVTWTRCE